MNVAAIREAARRVRDIVVTTPLKPAFDLSERLQAEVYLKLENTQDIGSFKIRGAANAILKARETEKFDHVVAASSGNHGRAVAYVAQKLGMHATICMTTLVPKDKIAAIERFGARTVIFGDDQNQAVEKALATASEQGAVYVPPFDHPDVIAGQGTIGLEMLEQQPELDTVIAPVSGGGLMSGVAIAVRELNANVEIIGVTSELDGAILESIEAGKVVMVQERPSIADALPGPIPLDNRYTFEICRDLVDKIIPIPETSVARAMRYVLDHEKMVLEGAGAASLAFVLDQGDELRGKKVGIVCSGNNISAERLRTVFQDFGI